MKIMNFPLFIAGALSFTAASLHMLIIIMGPSWYRFFGAGEQMATMAAQGHWQPTVITTAIALILAIWGCYGLSGAGLIRPLPLIRTALGIIASIYLLRGLGGLALGLLSSDDTIARSGLSHTFIIISSAICSVLGGLYLAGLYLLIKQQKA